MKPRPLPRHGSTSKWPFLLIVFLLSCIATLNKLSLSGRLLNSMSFVGSYSSPSTIRVMKTTATFTPTNYSVVPGYFIQDEPDFNATNYDPLTDSFGLINKSPDRWQNLINVIDKLNTESNDLTSYKLVILARHGEGFHNVAEATYGTKAWDDYWSRLTGDGNMTWGPDPKLTPLGIQQAKAVNKAWKKEIAAGAPTPQTLYSSPLSRSAKTLEITWDDILIKPLGIRPIFREHFRETIGLHTCDQRETKTYLQNAFPTFDFEVAFSEHDLLWSDRYQEVREMISLRCQRLLNEIFSTNNEPVISITAHGGVIGAVFDVVGHRNHAVYPGQFVPILVKANGDPNVKSRLFSGGRAVDGGPMPAEPPKI